MLVTDILARLRTDTSGFTAGMAGASRSLSDFQSRTNMASGSLQALGGAAKMAGAVATTAMAAAGMK